MSRPWMPLYVGDYLSDTGHLKTIEHGAYLLLIMHYWRMASLPPHDKDLARISRLSMREWLRAKPAIQPLFLNDWKHKRVEFELTEAARISEAGRKGGLASAAKRSTTVQRPFNDQPNDSSTTGQPLQSQSQLQRRKEEREKRSRASRLPSDWKPSEADFEFAHSRGMQHQRIASETEKFKNYWAGAIKNATSPDWSAKWRTWILKATEQGIKPNGHGKPNLGELADQLAEDLRQREFEIGIGR